MQYKVFIKNITHLGFLIFTDAVMFINTVLIERETIQIYPNRFGNQLETSLKSPA